MRTVSQFSFASPHLYSLIAIGLMELRQLKHAVTLAEIKNFGKAAELSFITQSAFSRSIQSLEDDLGVKLFDRSKREVHLTPYGEIFVKNARELVSQSVKLKRELELLKSVDEGELVIGCGPYVSAIYTAPLISRLLVLKPKIKVRVITDNWSNLAKMLRNDEIDLFVSDVREVDLKHDLHLDRLHEYPTLVVCRELHPLVSQETVRFKDLKRFPMISTAAPETVINQLGGMGFSLETDNTYLLKDIVSRSDAFFMATLPLVYKELEANTLKVVELADDPGIVVCCGIVSPKNRTPSPIVSMVIKELLALDEEYFHLSRPT